MRLADGSRCNHSSFWSARPDCPTCVGMYGHIPESPVFQGSWLEKQLLLLVKKLKRMRKKR